MAPVIERGAGCRVWDIDGNEYVEFGVCAAHDPAAIRQTVDAVADLMPAYQRAMESGVDHVLRGRQSGLPYTRAEEELVPCRSEPSW